ncbi:MAG: SDR family oxidoreductase [Fibrobacterota bacterium]
MRILIFGAGGLVGGHLLEAARREGIDALPVFHEFVPTAYKQKQCLKADITKESEAAFLIKEISPDCVVNLTALPVSVCEAHPKRAGDLIFKGTANIVSGLSNSIRYIHLSTDMVYDGLKEGFYTLEDRENPLNVYAKYKLQSEEYTKRSHENNVIIRSCLVLGRGLFRRGGFADWMHEKAINKERIGLFRDQNRTPITAEGLAAAIIRLASDNFTGILIGSGGYSMNRVEIGKIFLEANGFDLSLINEVSIEDVSSDAPLHKNLSASPGDFVRFSKIQPYRFKDLLRKSLLYPGKSHD